MATRLANGMMKLDMDAVKANLEAELQEGLGEKRLLEAMQQLQLVVYTMVGGGMLGNSAATQPTHFYVDSRCSKRPYAVSKIKQATDVLAIYAKVLGLQEPLNFKASFHNCGVF